MFIKKKGNVHMKDKLKGIAVDDISN